MGISRNYSYSILKRQRCYPNVVGRNRSTRFLQFTSYLRIRIQRLQVHIKHLVQVELRVESEGILDLKNKGEVLRI